MNRIITIGREFGSGGRELGKRLSDILGVAYYDHEIISEIAKRTSLAEDYVNRIVERSPNAFYPITIGRTFYPVYDMHLEQNTSIYAEQRSIIAEMAEKSDCVIVGRCADYILEDKNPTRIFVYADMESKMKRCRQKAGKDENLSDKQLKQKIKSIDKERARYYEFFAGRDWGDIKNFDLCINTSKLEIKDAANMIAKLFSED